MKLLHIQLFSKSYEANSSVALAHASDLSSFSFYQKTRWASRLAWPGTQSIGISG
jgi:hypothetical protein